MPRTPPEHTWATLVGRGSAPKRQFCGSTGCWQSMVKRHVHPDSRVSPCPDRVHDRRERKLRGLLGALPVCPTALLVFIYFLTGVQALVPSAWVRLRGRSRRSPGLSPWQPPLAPISRRCLQARERRQRLRSRQELSQDVRIALPRLETPSGDWGERWLPGREPWRPS